MEAIHGIDVEKAMKKLFQMKSYCRIQEEIR
jgi:hypothetical protein